MSESLRLLIADDEEDLTAILSRRFKQLGIEVECCFDAGACLRLFEAWGPHVALVDGLMPGNDGLWLIRQLRGCRPDVPLVMLSGSADQNFRAAALAAGVVRFLAKPCSLAEVEAALRAATHRFWQSPRDAHAGDGDGGTVAQPLRL